MLGAEIPAGLLERGAGVDEGRARLLGRQVALPMIAGLALACPTIGVKDADHARQLGIALDLRQVGTDAVEPVDNRLDRSKIGALFDTYQRRVVDLADAIAIDL